MGIMHSNITKVRNLSAAAPIVPLFTCCNPFSVSATRYSLCRFRHPPPTLAPT